MEWSLSKVKHKALNVFSLTNISNAVVGNVNMLFCFICNHGSCKEMRSGREINQRLLWAAHGWMLPCASFSWKPMIWKWVWFGQMWYIGSNVQIWLVIDTHLRAWLNSFSRKIKASSSLCKQYSTCICNSQVTCKSLKS